MPDEPRSADSASGDRPFVLIASLPRSGSTVLAEALTSSPNSLIHDESGICRGVISSRGLERLDGAVRELVAPAIDEISQIGGGDDKRFVRAYMRRVVPLLPFEQVGIKEIAFRRFLHRSVLAERPDTRVVIMARNPLDIWLSLEEMAARRKPGPWSYSGVGPDEAGQRMAGIHRQLDELTDDALVVHYEDLVSDPDVLTKVRAHVQSPLGELGEIGRYTSHRRTWEGDRHGSGFGTASVNRHRDADAESVARAEQFAVHLASYRSRFGY